MSEGTTILTSRLLEELLHFLGSLRKLIDTCGSYEVDCAAIEDLLEFKSLVAAAGKHREPWQELWQRHELLWEGPNSLLGSVPLLRSMCGQLVSLERTSRHTLAGLQALLALLRGWLEHATPAQREELTADRHTPVLETLETLARSILELLQALLSIYGIQQPNLEIEAELLKQAVSGARELGEEEERQELQAMQRDMLQAATDALWLANTVMQINPSFGIPHTTRRLSEWAWVLRGAEGLAWWEEDPASLELPMLLAELMLTCFEGPALSSQQKSAELKGQEDLLAFVVRGALRYVRAELEKCLQGQPGEPPSLNRCRRLFITEMLSTWLVDCATEHEDVLELWVKVLALVDEACEALAKPCIARVAVGRAHWDRLKILSRMQAALVLMHHDLLTAVWQRNARAAQLLEAAALNCAAAAVRTLARVCPVVCPEGGHQFVQTHMAIFVDSMCLVTGYINMLGRLEAPAFSSPAARQPGVPRPPGGLAVAAALDAVRLGEAVLRCALGVGRVALLKACRTDGLRGSSPASLCISALTIVCKWAMGKLPAASGGQPELYLLQLTRGQSGLDALLSLLATQRKLAQAVAQGLPLANEDTQQQWEGLHQSVWKSSWMVTQIALSLASRLSSGGGSSSSSGGGGGGSGAREKEAIACLAITTANHLVSATFSRAAATAIFTPDRAFMGLLILFGYFHSHDMLFSALRLGGGALMDSVFRAAVDLEPSPRASTDRAISFLNIFSHYSDLVLAALHGGLVRHAVEAYLAWLQTDDFQATRDNWGLLKVMEKRFRELCETTAQEEVLMEEHGYDFIKRFPKSKLDRTKAKRELRHVWGLRARQLCPHLEQAARAAVRAELAAAPGAEFVPQLVESPLAGACKGTNLAAAIELAASVAAASLAQREAERMVQAAQEVGGPEARAAAAEAEAAARHGLEQAASALLQATTKEEPAVLLEELKKDSFGQAVSTEAAQPAAASGEAAPPAAACAGAAPGAAVREGGAAAEAAEGAPGLGCGTPAVASGAARPTAQPMRSCPVAFAIRDLAVSRAGCANPQCRNLSGVSESELPRLMCRGCLSACYCSEACGREDWPRHGCVCRLVRLMRLGLSHCRQPTEMVDVTS